ncbi:PQQ-binding-like beta-propeller repeat protein [Ktedonosporobacter rubrisoli]|nr:PQQ-binding-like beta-propeller repeat protein [Ktedonosporobacter rubrisoli]
MRSHTLIQSYRSVGICALLLFLVGCGSTAPQSAAPSPTPASTPPGQSTAQTAPTHNADWTTYHYDNTRAGMLPDMPNPHQLSVAWKSQLDGAVYAEPLVIGDSVIVATEGDTLYALDRHTGRVQWHVNVGNPVSLSTLPCGNIDPLGITGTPVYDPASHLVFAVAEIQGPSHILVGVDVNTGKIRMRRVVDPAGIEPKYHQQRSALALSQGMVYITYGGLYGDCGNYHGWVIASRTDGNGSLLTYKVPTAREGGIWAPPGPVIDSKGDLYVAVGNGEATQGDWDHTDSVLRLSSSLKLEDGFAPTQWQQDNANDADLGSMSPVLLSNGLIVSVGKSGETYLLHANALGGVGGQIQKQSICPSYGGAASTGTELFLPCTDGLRQIKVGDGPSLNVGWQAHGQVTGSPTIGGHTVYSLDRGGTLYALNIADGSVRATASVGQTSRFASPTLSGKQIFVGTMAGVVAVSIS